MPGPIPRLSQADLANPAAMERIAAVANSAHLFSVSEGMEAHATPGGRGILHLSVDRIVDRRLAAVAGNTPVYTDCRYRLMVLTPYPTGTGGANPNPPKSTDLVPLSREFRSDLYPESGTRTTDPKTTDVGEYITAINIAEIFGWSPQNYLTPSSVQGTHLLIDQAGNTMSYIVEAWCLYDDEANPQPHWFFNYPPPEQILVQLVTDGSTAYGPTYKMNYRGTTIGTGQTPLFGRTAGVTPTGSGYGIAYADRVNNKYVLAFAGEGFSTTACT